MSPVTLAASDSPQLIGTLGQAGAGITDSMPGAAKKNGQPGCPFLLSPGCLIDGDALCFR